MQLQTVEIHMKRLLRSFTVCLVNLMFIQIIKICNKHGRCPNLAERPNLPVFTLPLSCTHTKNSKKKL